MPLLSIKPMGCVSWRKARCCGESVAMSEIALCHSWLSSISRSALSSAIWNPFHTGYPPFIPRDIHRLWAPKWIFVRIAPISTGGSSFFCGRWPTLLGVFRKSNWLSTTLNSGFRVLLGGRALPFDQLRSVSGWFDRTALTSVPFTSCTNGRACITSTISTIGERRVLGDFREADLSTQ
jgi:hypothetical protein